MPSVQVRSMASQHASSDLELLIHMMVEHCSEKLSLQRTQNRVLLQLVLVMLLDNEGVKRLKLSKCA